MWNLFYGTRRSRTSRRRSNAGIPKLADVDVLETRLVLAAPGPVSVVGVDYPDGTVQSIDIQWEDVAEADEYQYWIAYSNMFNIDGGTTTETHLNYSDLTTSEKDEPAYRYRIWVRGINEDGVGLWGPMFDWNAPGDAPSEQPQSNVTLAVGSGLTTFYTTHQVGDIHASWEPIEGAQQYDVWVSLNGERIGDIRQVSGARRFSSFSEDAEGGVYQIWVRARNGQGTGPWSQAYVCAPGSQPEITGPVGNALEARPEITWSAGTDNVNYEVWLTHETSGTVTRYHDLEGTSFTPDTDLADGTYAVWVRQVSENNIPMPWSSRYSFEVGTSTRPDVPVLSATDNTSTDDVDDYRGIFHWTPVAGAVSYEIYIGNPRGGYAEYTMGLTQTEHISIPLDVNVYSNYRVWVRALGTSGKYSDWSERVEVSVIHGGDVLVQ